MNDFDAVQFSEIAAILFAGSLVQGLVGFASGLLAVPLLLMVNVPLRDAVAMAAVASFAQNLLAAYSLRHAIVVREAVRPTLIRLAALPVGLFLLSQTTNLDQARVRQIIGAVILVLLLVQLRHPRRERQRWPTVWEWLAFASSGLMLGFCGMGGPPVVMWAMAQPWPVEKARALLFFVFLSTMIPQLLLLWATFGSEIGAPMLAGLCGTPAVFLGTYAGLKLARWTSPERLRVVTFAVLAILSIYEIAAPWLGR